MSAPSKNPFKSAKFRAAIYSFVGTLLTLCAVIFGLDGKTIAAILSAVGALSNLLALLNVPFGFTVEDDGPDHGPEGDQ